jgi:hypothetical protein
VAAGNVAAAEEKPAAAEDALTAEAAPPATAGARSGVMAARERKPPVPGRLAAPPDPARLAAERYQSLLDQRPATVADARALRDGWEAFVRDQPSGPHADEARVRAIEAGATAWRLGGDVADLDRTRAAADAYLAVADAPQRLRVRAVREALPD